MKKLLMIIVLIAFWSYSNGQSSYFPAKKGTNWTYAFGKEIYGGTPYENYTSEIKILDATEVIDGKEYFVSETSMGGKEGDKTVIKTYFRFGNDGSLISKIDKDKKEFVSMNKSPKVGDIYTSQQGGTSKVVDLNATIKTPITTYTNCLMIEINESQTISRAYYQKNTGMIATTMIMDGKEKIFIYLVSE
jgi:hypothetical protein